MKARDGPWKANDTCWSKLLLLLFSLIRLFRDPHGLCSPRASLSMGFPRQEYWSGLPFPFPGDLLNPGIKAWQADSLPLSHQGSPWNKSYQSYLELPSGQRADSHLQVSVMPLCPTVLHLPLLLLMEDQPTLTFPCVTDENPFYISFRQCHWLPFITFFSHTLLQNICWVR